MFYRAVRGRREGFTVEKALAVSVGEDLVRFTPDGRVSVIDAIQAVISSARADTIWTSLKSDHPDILIYCEEYPFRGGDLLTVTGTEGWEKIWMLLPFYLSNEDLL